MKEQLMLDVGLVRLSSLIIHCRLSHGNNPPCWQPTTSLPRDNLIPKLHRVDEVKQSRHREKKRIYDGASNEATAGRNTSVFDLCFPAKIMETFWGESTRSLRGASPGWVWFESEHRKWKDGLIQHMFRCNDYQRCLCWKCGIMCSDGKSSSVG